jgi:hypothetical protein
MIPQYGHDYKPPERLNTILICRTFAVKDEIVTKIAFAPHDDTSHQKQKARNAAYESVAIRKLNHFAMAQEKEAGTQVVFWRARGCWIEIVTEDVFICCVSMREIVTEGEGGCNENQ